MQSPTAINEVMRQARSMLDFIPCPTTCWTFCKSSAMGMMKSLQFHHQVSSVVRHVKGSKRDLSRRINCYASNAGTGCCSRQGRLADSQYSSRGRRVVVVRKRVMPLTWRRTLAESSRKGVRSRTDRCRCTAWDATPSVQRGEFTKTKSGESRMR